VVDRTGNLADGVSGAFSAENNPDSRLNLSAVLVPSNDFTVAVTRDRKRGTATLTVNVSNAGTASVAGKGLKLGRAAKSVHGAGPVNFQVAPVGKRKRKLLRTGRLKLGAEVTFAPTGGDANTRPVTLKLRRKRLVR
jgi:hypothetical protein